MVPDLASVLLSCVIGLALGIFGGGGSILAVPVLVLVTHLAPAGAVGTSLAMVGTTSLIASYAHHRQGLVKPKVALLFGLSGVVTAFLGARLTGLVSGSVIMHGFAVMMAGAGVGLVTGFLGVGGGFLVVPALIAFAGLDMREAVGTSLLVIAINSAAGFLGHLGSGQLDVSLIAGLTAAAVAGALVGERIARHMEGDGPANGLRSFGCKTQVLRALAPMAAAKPDWLHGAALAGRHPYPRMWLALHSPTDEEVPWPA